jgi:hypothetical protein
MNIKYGLLRLLNRAVGGANSGQPLRTPQLLGVRMANI